MQLNQVRENLNIFNTFGRNEKNGGVNRLALTHQERVAALKFSMLCQQAGLDVYFDFLGNVIARREGKYPDLQPVVIGSHIDTVKDGGQYDGLLGVVGALEVVNDLNRRQIETDHPIVIIAFTCEESTRFNQATIGSKYLTGQYTREDLKDIKDNDGQVLYDIVYPLSQDMQNQTALFERNHIKAYLELHIEQGPILENKQKDIGIVTHIAAPHRFRLKLHGETSHSGSTPMPMRVDALTGASEIIVNVERIANDFHEEGVVGAVGYADVYPNSMNAIPGEVTLLIDIRGKGYDSREAVVTQVKKMIQDVTARRGLSFELEDLGQDIPVDLNPHMAHISETACDTLGYSHRRMFSGAGHDAMNFAPICPTSMIFIPCEKGISHSPKESVTDAQIEKGVQILIYTAIEVARKDTHLE